MEKEQFHGFMCDRSSGKLSFRYGEKRGKVFGITSNDRRAVFRNQDVKINPQTLGAITFSQHSRSQRSEAERYWSRVCVLRLVWGE